MANLEKIELLQSTKKDIKAAIEEKGQEVDEIPFSQYPEKIRSISSGGTDGDMEIIATILDGSVSTIEIPPVSEIGTYVFAYCNELTLINLPNSITKIGASAFQGCKNLAFISLPDGLTDIAGSAFQGCSNLALTSLPDGLTSIGISSFSSCINLAITTVPQGITKINSHTFYNCDSLTEFLVPETVTIINQEAFYGCKNLKKVTFLGTTRLYKFPFRGCTGMTINVPWAKGEVSGAPWGATSSTINFEYKGE